MRYIAALIVALLTFPEQADWVTFDAGADFGFIVNFPHEPREETHKGGDPKSNGYVSQVYSATEASVFYEVVITDYGPQVSINPETELLANRDAFVGLINAQLKSSRRITYDRMTDRLPALEFTAVTPQRKYRGVIVVDRRRVYQVTAGAATSVDRTEMVNAFFDSFLLQSTR